MRSPGAVAVSFVLLALPGCYSCPPHTAILLSPDIQHEPPDARAGEPVHFRIDSYAHLHGQTWAFGDGETSKEAAPTHVYGEPGTYTVRITTYVCREENGGNSTLIKVL